MSAGIRSGIRNSWRCGTAAGPAFSRPGPRSGCGASAAGAVTGSPRGAVPPASWPHREAPPGSSEDDGGAAFSALSGIVRWPPQPQSAGTKVVRLAVPVSNLQRGAAGILNASWRLGPGGRAAPAEGGLGLGVGDDSVAGGTGSSRVRGGAFPGELPAGALMCRSRTTTSNHTTLTWGVLTGEQRWLADVPHDHEQPGSVTSKCVRPSAGMWVGCAHANPEPRAAARRRTTSAAVACAVPLQPRGAGCGIRAAGPAPYSVEHGPFGGPLRCRVR